jgi:FkbM family methyltransferase
VRSLVFVVVDDPYRTDYTGTVVLDLGAHKGYYGAYALAHGASVVISFEPERANLELLRRAAGMLGEAAGTWQVRDTAIGAQSGTAALHVMGASWGHALDPPERFAEHEVGSQVVRVEALPNVLAEAEALKGVGARLVVKLNVEGAECDAVLGTAPSAWTAADEVFVETHPWASCGADDLCEHLASAGLTPTESAHRLVLRLRREG